MFEFLAVGAGGFLGSCARFALTRVMQNYYDKFPFGTLLSNVIAGLLIGFIVGLEQQAVRISPRTKLFLTTGMLGGLSTFSTFSLETITFFQGGKYFVATANVLLNLCLSLIGVAVGLYLAKTIVKA